MDEISAHIGREKFWQNPPWADGLAKHRLGLTPKHHSDWQAPISAASFAYKQNMLKHRYSDVVGVHTPVGDDRLADAFAQLGKLACFQNSKALFDDDVANFALMVDPDLCVLDIADQQRLIAGCVCSPSYWRIQEKVGRPLSAVHGDVPLLNEQLGGRIAHFLENQPLNQPFCRTNWFIHGDGERFHIDDEEDFSSHPHEWVMRCEFQTLYKFSPRYVLFCIQVVCRRLVELAAYPQQLIALRKAMQQLGGGDHHATNPRIEYFGGRKKYALVCDYLDRLIQR